MLKFFFDKTRLFLVYDEYSTVWSIYYHKETQHFVDRYIHVGYKHVDSWLNDIYRETYVYFRTAFLQSKMGGIPQTQWVFYMPNLTITSVKQVLDKTTHKVGIHP